jgi:hypothetical protein
MDENLKNLNLKTAVNPNVNDIAADSSQSETEKKYGLDMTFEDYKKKYGRKYRDDA